MPIIHLPLRLCCARSRAQRARAQPHRPRTGPCRSQRGGADPAHGGRSLSRVAENSTLISMLMTCSSAWMESALADPARGQHWVIYDEAWRLMAYPARLRRIDAQWRLARHFGIANMLIFHKLSDLDNVGDSGSAMRALAASLLANAGNPHRLPTGTGPTRIHRERARTQPHRAEPAARARHRPGSLTGEGSQLCRATSTAS